MRESLESKEWTTFNEMRDEAAKVIAEQNDLNSGFYNSQRGHAITSFGM